jgi:hypothetical protein
MAATITTAHVNKTLKQVAADPTHLLSSGNGTSVTCVVGRDGVDLLKVTGSSTADCILAYEAFVGVAIHDGKTKTY